MRFISQIILLFIFCCHAFADEVVDELSGEEVNCSNIMDYVQSYLELSTMDHTLLAMTANRFKSKAHTFFPGAIIPDHQKPSMEDLETFKSDIGNAVHTVHQNQQFLIQKSDVIREVLPGCLK